MQSMAKTGHIRGSSEAVVLPRNSGLYSSGVLGGTQDTAVGSTAAHLEGWTKGEYLMNISLYLALKVN